MENSAESGRNESGERYPAAKATELVLGDFVAREGPPSPRRSWLPVVLAALGSLAMIGAASGWALTELHARWTKPPVAPAPSETPAETPPTSLPITVTEAPAVSASSASSASPSPRVIARPRVRTASSAPTVTTTTTSPKTKCCAGESEMACHMRIAVGGTCG